MSVFKGFLLAVLSFCLAWCFVIGFGMLHSTRADLVAVVAYRK